MIRTVSYVIRCTTSFSLLLNTLGELRYWTDMCIHYKTCLPTTSTPVKKGNQNIHYKHAAKSRFPLYRNSYGKPHRTVKSEKGEAERGVLYRYWGKINTCTHPSRDGCFQFLWSKFGCACSSLIGQRWGWRGI